MLEVWLNQPLDSEEKGSRGSGGGGGGGGVPRGQGSCEFLRFLISEDNGKILLGFIVSVADKGKGRLQSNLLDQFPIPGQECDF